MLKRLWSIPEAGSVYLAEELFITGTIEGTSSVTFELATVRSIDTALTWLGKMSLSHLLPASIGNTLFLRVDFKDV